MTTRLQSITDDIEERVIRAWRRENGEHGYKTSNVRPVVELDTSGTIAAYAAGFLRFSWHVLDSGRLQRTPDPAAFA